MKLRTKIAAGILLGIGLPIVLSTAVDVFHPNTPKGDRRHAAEALILFGLPPSILGGGLIWSASRRRKQDERDRLRDQFFQLLTEGDGHITVLRFAMETGLEGDVAKQYLDDRAKEFNASYNVTEEGKFSYYFDVGSSAGVPLPEAASVSPSLPKRERFDVVLETIPAGQQSEILKEIQEITGVSWSEANAMLKQLPGVVVCRAVTEAKAHEFRNRLQRVGAKVTIELS